MQPNRLPDTISVLPPEVAARIAAGEVIERPASVVKELVENAFDAGARQVEVLIEGGGLELIRVADNGAGIPSAQIELAFERHGTSKLRSDSDLPSITTFGFRGEALPSIAAVAQVRCLTRSASEAVGQQVELRGGKEIRREAKPRQRGTTITVEDLFADLPARRRFLRTRAAEGTQVAQVVGHLALARPDVALRLILDGRTIFSTAGDGDLRSAALAVRGSSFARGAIVLEQRTLRTPAGKELGRLHGLLGSIQEQRNARSGLSLFVNGRWIQNRQLSHAIEEGYRTLIRTGRYPVAILFLDVPLSTVDVNVHPAKSEVRLLHERELYPLVRDAVMVSLPTSQHAWDGELEAGMQAGLGWGQLEPRVLGQVGATYIVVEGNLGLYLVDQHAAHERILLERLQAGQRPEQQMLLVPEVVEPGDVEIDGEQLCEALVELGFEAEPFGSTALLVRAVPAVMAERPAIGGLEQVLAQLMKSRSGADWRPRLAVELACKTAIRAGESLSGDEMLAMIRQLGETGLKDTCAHGRPTSVLLSHDQLARQFGRV